MKTPKAPAPIQDELDKLKTRGLLDNPKIKALFFTAATRVKAEQGKPK